MPDNQDTTEVKTGLIKSVREGFSQDVCTSVQVGINDLSVSSLIQTAKAVLPVHTFIPLRGTTAGKAVFLIIPLAIHWDIISVMEGGF